MSELPETWTAVRLGDVLSVKHGFAFPGNAFSEDPALPTLVTPGNFAIGGGFKEARAKTFAGHYPPEYELVAGDLVVTMTDLSKGGDTLGSLAIVPVGVTYLHNQRIGLVQIADRSAVDGRFLSYGLRGADYRSYIVGTASGSTVRHTSPSKICDFVALLPPIAEQQAIAEVLGALDDKIAANRKLAETADLLAKAQFTSMLADSQSVPLSATAQFVNGKAFTKGASGTGRVVIRIAELNSGIGGSTVFSDIEVDDQFVARPGDLLFAWSGSLTLHRWFRDEAIVNQHIFKVIPADGYSPWLLFQLIQEKLPRFKDIAADKATTMGHIQRKHLDEPVLVPSPAQVERLEATMTALWDRALLAERESLQLTTLRDTLLPRLMSGDLRVRDAEKQVEAAL
ncbi:restriction endonuclease subunit S [Rhodococcus sp. NPDC054953]